MGSATTGMQDYAEPTEKAPARRPIIQLYVSLTPHIPSELVPSCRFLAYTWGTSTRDALWDDSLQLVTLGVDLGLQHSIRVLVAADNVAAVMERTLRRITLRPTQGGGLDITGIDLGGLGVGKPGEMDIPSSTTH